MNLNKSPSDKEWASIGKIVMLAAFADGELRKGEKAAFEAMTEGWSKDERRNVLHPIFAEQVQLEKEVACLTSNNSRRIAFKAAWRMCKSDGVVTLAEAEFLSRLTKALSKRM
jgi:hypothetical protein